MQDAALFDAAIAAYLLNPLKGSYEAEDLARDYLDWMVPSKSELLGKMPLHQAAVEQREDFLRYVCRMAAIAYQVLPVLEERLYAEDMMKLFTEVEMPLVFTLRHMEDAGIGVEREALASYGSQLSGRIGELEQQICEEAGEIFNINSPKQLGVILFEKLQLPHGKKTKTGYSTAADVLEKLAVGLSDRGSHSGVPAADKAEIDLRGWAGELYCGRMEGFMENSIRRSRRRGV